MATREECLRAAAKVFVQIAIRIEADRIAAEREEKLAA